ncbi:MAG: IS66 family transposase, partial [Nocardiopsaceae bacterium]|nr:IS66 family transposase [Nocardiopsaceae bacterium]
MMTVLVQRHMPRRRSGHTTAVTIGGERLCFTANGREDGALDEVFIRWGKQGTTASGLMDLYATAISTGLQHGVPLIDLIRPCLGLSFVPNGYTDDPEIPRARSVVDYLSRRLAIDWLPDADRAALGVFTTTSERGQQEMPCVPLAASASSATGPSHRSLPSRSPQRTRTLVWNIGAGMRNYSARVGRGAGVSCCRGDRMVACSRFVPDDGVSREEWHAAERFRLMPGEELAAVAARQYVALGEMSARLERLEEHAAGRLRAREAELLAELEAERAQVKALRERVEWLSRRLGKDSSNSSKPPSSDGPFRGPRPRGRSSRQPSGRKPGKQPGAPSPALGQVPDPDARAECAPLECRACGAGLSGAPVTGEQRLQVFEAQPAPPPRVTGYVVQARECPCCGEVTEGRAPAGVTGRVQYGPRVHALSALLTSWHHVPVARSVSLLSELAGVRVSAGFAAGARGRAAALLAPFMDRVRELLASAGVLHADETPVRAAGRLRHLHVACTPFLTAMHPAGRTCEGIDAGRILPGYAGVLVRDGYAGYQHLADAAHAWCGAHLLRDLQGLCDAGPGQEWAEAMAGVLR